jgi:1-acyl-sn-glycerol-3-phosphate acyltransferase
MVEAGRPGQMVPGNRVSSPANQGLGLPQSRGPAGNDGKARAFNQDNFQLAANLGAPIVPFYIGIPREIDPGRGFDTLPGTVHVYLQPAISTHGWTPENLESSTEMVRDIFVKIQEELRA